eukprot:gene16742-biopygen8032
MASRCALSRAHGCSCGAYGRPWSLLRRPRSMLRRPRSMLRRPRSMLRCQVFSCCGPSRGSLESAPRGWRPGVRSLGPMRAPAAHTGALGRSYGAHGRCSGAMYFLAVVPLAAAWSLHLGDGVPVCALSGPWVLLRRIRAPWVAATAPTVDAPAPTVDAPVPVAWARGLGRCGPQRSIY